MFSSKSGSGLNHYNNVAVESLTSTAAPHQLVLMLYDGAQAAIAQAKGHMERGEIEAKGNAISKAISIIDGGLKASLDLKVGGALAQNLFDLYVYMEQRLLKANLKNDYAALEEVALLLEQLRDAWRSIAAKPAPAVSAQADHVPGAPEITKSTARANPTQAYSMAAASAPPQNRSSAAPGAPPAIPAKANVASTPPTGAPAVGANVSQTPPLASTAPTGTPPAGTSIQQRRLAAAYGRI